MLPIIWDGKKVSSTHYYLLPERLPYLSATSAVCMRPRALRNWHSLPVTLLLPPSSTLAPTAPIAPTATIRLIPETASNPKANFFTTNSNPGTRRPALRATALYYRRAALGMGQRWLPPATEEKHGRLQGLKQQTQGEVQRKAAEQRGQHGGAQAQRQSLWLVAAVQAWMPLLPWSSEPAIPGQTFPQQGIDLPQLCHLRDTGNLGRNSTQRLTPSSQTVPPFLLSTVRNRFGLALACGGPHLLLPPVLLLLASGSWVKGAVPEEIHRHSGQTLFLQCRYSPKTGPYQPKSWCQQTSPNTCTLSPTTSPVWTLTWLPTSTVLITSPEGTSDHPSVNGSETRKSRAPLCLGSAGPRLLIFVLCGLLLAKGL
ncbi:trem-like transcript 4 protein [Cebus imitator]|uniref:trem-like transcript 4 protein n=1 Tax=Cebus imitator TaxID=2715852 RepID=UPI00189A5B57|nr:trem-like transcript 4 protein [Cebus imitator]